jgi:putative nucleotidyltransferase with HDIG domain
MNLKTAPDAPKMLHSVETHTRQTVAILMNYMIVQGKTDYLGEPVTQLEHSLQCAHLARQDAVYGHDDEVVLGALLHDVGRFIPSAEKMEKMYSVDGEYLGRTSHEVVGEHYLRSLGFSDKVAELVGAHVMAKRYLTATDKEYYDGLSETSKRTLEYQVRIVHLSTSL